jgi:hypothetical protein
MTLPAKISLSCIEYHVREHEGAVILTEACPIWGCGTKLVFTRPEGCWYVEIINSRNACMVSHIEKAMRMLEEVYGGNHKKKEGAKV